MYVNYHLLNIVLLILTIYTRNFAHFIHTIHAIATDFDPIYTTTPYLNDPLYIKLPLCGMIFLKNVLTSQIPHQYLHFRKNTNLTYRLIFNCNFVVFSQVLTVNKIAKYIGTHKKFFSFHLFPSSFHFVRFSASILYYTFHFSYFTDHIFCLQNNFHKCIELCKFTYLLESLLQKTVIHFFCRYKC